MKQKKHKKEKKVFQIPDEKLSKAQKEVLRFVNDYELEFFITFTPSFLADGLLGIFCNKNYDTLLSKFMGHVEKYLFGKEYGNYNKIMHFFAFKEFGKSGTLTHYHILTLKHKLVSRTKLREAFKYACAKCGLREDCIKVGRIYAQEGCIKYSLKEWKYLKRSKYQRYVYVKSTKDGESSCFFPSNIVLNKNFITVKDHKRQLKAKTFELHLVKNMIKTAKAPKNKMANTALFAKTLWNSVKLLYVNFIAQYVFYKDIYKYLSKKLMNKYIIYWNKWTQFFKQAKLWTKKQPKIKSIWKSFIIKRKKSERL